MAVAFDAAVGSAQGNATSYTIAHTITGSNPCLIVGVSFAGSTTVSTMTWNTSENLSRLCSVQSYSSRTVEFWYLVGPTTGTHNVVITPSASALASVQIASFTGVDQTTPVGTPVYDAYVDTGTPHAHDTTGVVNGMGVDMFAIQDAAGTITPNGGQTTRSGPTNSNSYISILTTKAGATTINTGYGWVTDYQYWGHTTVGLNPVAAVTARHRIGLLGVG